MVQSFTLFLAYKEEDLIHVHATKHNDTVVLEVAPITDGLPDFNGVIRLHLSDNNFRHLFKALSRLA